MEPDPLASGPRQVEAYLDQILAPLVRSLSPFHQDELRRELRDHLWARVASYRELGHPEEEAVTEALRQFGGAEDFLRQWRRDWKTTPQATLREVWYATRCALLLSIPLLLIPYLDSLGSTLWLPPGTLVVHASQFVWAPKWMHDFYLDRFTLGWGSFMLGFVVLPLALGAMVGRLTPQRAGTGMLAALATEVVLSDWLGVSSTGPNLGWFAERLSFQVFICTTAWLPLACTSAVLTGWWRQRSEARRLA